MKNKIVLILSVFAVMVLSVVSVYGITEQSREVEKAYAAVPNGAFLAKFGVRYDPSLYTYYIDTSVVPPLNGSMGATGSVFTAYYSDGTGYFYAGFDSTSSRIGTYLYPPSGNGSSKTLYSSSSWNSSLIIDGHLLGSDGSFSRLELTSSFGTNNWLYVVPNSVPPVTQSTTVIFNTAQIDSLIFDGINFTTSGQSQEITYDNEDEYYTLSVTPKSGYEATYAVVEYLNDADNELPARYQITNSTAQIACPVGDAITSITIESEPISVGVLSYLQIWSPNVSGDYSGQIDYSGTSGTLVLPTFTLTSLQGSFSDYSELWNYVYNLMVDSGSNVLFDVKQYSVIGVRYRDDTSVTFPLSASNYDASKGGLVFLTRRYTSTVSFSLPSQFAFYSSIDFSNNDGKFPYNDNVELVSRLNYYVAPYALSNYWFLLVNDNQIDVSGNTIPVSVYIDGAYFEGYTCDLYLSSAFFTWDIKSGVDLSPVSSDLLSLSRENNTIYYLNNVVYSNGAGTGTVVELYFTEGVSYWQPTMNDALEYFGNIFDGVLDILDVYIAADITIGTILLIVLALGVLLFVFRISGVF